MAEEEMTIATGAGLRAANQRIDQLHERLIAVSLMNIELTKMLVNSGVINRAKLLQVFDLLKESQVATDSPMGVQFTQMVRDLLAAQTSEPTNDGN